MLLLLMYLLLMLLVIFLSFVKRTAFLIFMYAVVCNWALPHRQRNQHLLLFYSQQRMEISKRNTRSSTPKSANPIPTFDCSISFRELILKIDLYSIWIIQKMLQPRIELGPKRWQRSILPLNYCSLTIYLGVS